MSLKDFKPLDDEDIKAELFKMFQEQSQRPSLLQEIQTCPTFAKLESAFSKHRLLLFVPNEKIPAVAFKGGCWNEALKLKPESAITMSLTEALENLNNKQ